MLGGVSHVEGREPHLVRLPCALCSEEMLTSVDPAEWIFLAIKGRERQLVEPWDGSSLGVFIMDVLNRWRRGVETRKWRRGVGEIDVRGWHRLASRGRGVEHRC